MMNISLRDYAHKAEKNRSWESTPTWYDPQTVAASSTLVMYANNAPEAWYSADEPWGRMHEVSAGGGRRYCELNLCL